MVISKVFMIFYYMFNYRKRCNVFSKEIEQWAAQPYDIRHEFLLSYLSSSFSLIFSIFLALSVTMLYIWQLILFSTVWIISLHFLNKNNAVFLLALVSSTSTIYDFPLTWTHEAVIDSLSMMSVPSLSFNFFFQPILLFQCEQNLKSYLLILCV